MAILVTGGTGYIASHTILEFLNRGYDVIALDNLSNSKRESLRRVNRLTGRQCPLEVADLLDSESLNNLFDKYSIDGVIHFAGKKAVGESVEKPLLYYRTNVEGTLNLVNIMQQHGVNQIVFSSSCTVYGDPENVPVDESFPVSPTNPYGHSKAMVEQILRDLCVSDSSFGASLLRYFNPAGAHPSGEIGEDPLGTPGNLMPYLLKVATGKLPELRIFGDDYPTVDGTGVRDYIHVLDLANGHLLAWEKISDEGGIQTYNLGTGKGYSVHQLISATEKVSGKAIPFTITDRRPGDVAETWADPSRAIRELGWRAERGLEEICRDSWNWQQKNPEGYPDP